jgi:hypothetical protein
MSGLVSPAKWKSFYAAAMLEPNNAHLLKRIQLADAAIKARLNELPETYSVRAEQLELQSALKYLECLKNSLSLDSR